MGLLGASNFLGIISSYRLLWIGGRFGGHKTSLAYRIYQDYGDRGYRLISNNQSVWNEDIERIGLLPDGTLKAFVLLDEGGLEFKSSRQIEMIASYARKMDVIYCLPSFWPPTRSAQVLICQPVFNFKQTGIPLICYKWSVKIGSFKDQGVFFWWEPQEIYGIYSSADPGDRATEIVQWLIERTEDYRQRHGYDKNEVSEMEITPQDIMADAAEQIAGAADAFEAVSIRKRKRR